MYYLLEQKQHVRRLKKAESMKTQIRQNSSNLSKPETGSDTNENNKPTSSGHQQIPPSSTQGQKVSAPIKLTSIEPLAPINANPPVEKTIKDDKNVPIKTFVPVTPYLQAPFILQQQQQQLNQRQAHNNMPSLDAYLRGGVELPQNVANNNFEQNALFGAAQPAKPNVGSVMVPPLNLRANKPNTNNATSASMAMATGSLLGNRPVALTSQTARGPAPTAASSVAAPNSGIYEGNPSGPVHPHTARTPLPSDMPVEILERPNTRRSHLRSRGGEHAVELAPAQALAPGEGLDSMPPTRETAPQMPVRRPEPVAADRTGSSLNTVESAASAMAMLMISNKKTTSEHSTPSAPVAMAVIPVAPEAPKSSAGASSSSSGAFAGRRGRNIAGVNSSVATDAPLTSATSNVASTSTTHPVQPVPPAGNRPQPRPAAQLSKPTGSGLSPLAPVVANSTTQEVKTSLADPQ